MGVALTTIKSILAASDFSEDARNALSRAGRIAAEQQATLALLHVISGFSLDALRTLLRDPAGVEAGLMDEATRELRQDAEQLAAQHGVKVSPEVRIGGIDAEILQATRQVDLLVAGVRGASPLRDLLLGSTAERLLSKCPRPVLVVKRPPAEAYRRVLVPIDLSPASAGVIDLAMQIAPKAEITVFHAFDLPFEGKLRLAGVTDADIQEYRVRCRNQAMTGIDALLAGRNGNGTPPLRMVDRGDAPRLILEYEVRTQSDLIVMGRRRQGAIEQFLLGSVARHVLADSKCDVLIDAAPPAEHSGTGVRSA
jgi:nucleotide-binding universal stress UspA family protein